MLTGAVRWCVCAVVVVMFGCVGGCSLASHEGKSLTLSEALSQVELFAGLTEAERDVLKTSAALRQGKEGEVIIRQGEALDSMFIVLGGEVEVRVDGKRFVTLSGQPLVGEIEFLDKLPASADVVLLKKSNIIELNNVALSGLMEKNPRLGYVLMREFAKIEAQRLRTTTQK